MPLVPGMIEIGGIHLDETPKTLPHVSSPMGMWILLKVVTLHRFYLKNLRSGCLQFS